MTSIPFSPATLDSLPDSVGRTVYARDDLSAGILHFGVGNFHLTHQTTYLDRLFAAGDAQNWAIVGAGVFNAERRGRAVLAAQDWLTTLVEQEAETSEAKVIGSMIDYVEPANGLAIVARMVQPDIRIVSLTITDGGYSSTVTMRSIRRTPPSLPTRSNSSVLTGRTVSRNSSYRSCAMRWQG